MTATRSPVRLVVLHNGDYCDDACSAMYGQCPCGDGPPRRGVCGMTDTPLDYDRERGANLRTEACKAATAPRSCVGCVYLDAGHSGPYCDKYDQWIGHGHGVAYRPEPIMQCDGPNAITRDQ